ncbi:xanthine phosphoribosyltransferase [Anaerosalibacter massiliensis]|uniref:Xanthine phosphoribosyltransferase n=1 Tax=Anaerosalibacter massiliensis TaxID=1347392 RepID=A0A9X2MFI8_9FIRM|nr:xanthine phosphoribosyltransferase [Anaerosalibacter massiliensis]MCR2043098.1 xanthine phosphoribosyltransferase [Anaerosalibacter massiliensis]
MELLKEKILKEGRVEEGNILKVDSFLNHQLDIELLNEIGKEFKKRFKNENITKILTIETSGIAIGAITAQYFNVPVLFARKTESKNLDNETYESNVYSYTKEKNYKIRVAERYLNENDRVLLIDDFLANGKALLGLIDITKQAKATLVGAGIVIEKGFQHGGDNLRNNGIRVDSLAIIDSLEDGKIVFR